MLISMHLFLLFLLLIVGASLFVVASPVGAAVAVVTTSAFILPLFLLLLSWLLLLGAALAAVAATIVVVVVALVVATSVVATNILANATADVNDVVVTARVPQLMRAMRAATTASWHTSLRSHRSLCTGFRRDTTVVLAIAIASFYCFS